MHVIVFVTMSLISQAKKFMGNTAGIKRTFFCTTNTDYYYSRKPALYTCITDYRKARTLGLGALINYGEDSLMRKAPKRNLACWVVEHWRPRASIQQDLD
jgi:hypothetical protein